MDMSSSRNVPPVGVAEESLGQPSANLESGIAGQPQKTQAGRSSRFLQGAVFGYSYQALTMIVGLWLTRFLLRHLGQHDYGLWLTALQIMTYLGLVDFGIVALLPRTVAYATGRAGGTKNASDLPDIIGQTAIIVLGQTPLVALAAAVAWLFLPAEWLALRGPLTLIMGAFVVLFPLRMFAAVLEGLQEQAFVVRANMLSWIVGTLSNVLLILAGFGLYSVAAGWLLSQTMLAAACAYRLWSHHREVLPSRPPKLSKPETFRRLGRGFWMSLNQVGQVLMAGTDVLVISKLLGPSIVVPYACTGKLASVLANQPQMLMHLATPGLSEMKTGSSKERVYQVMIALSQGMLLLTGLLFCVILVVNQGFVDWWVGAKQYGGFALTCLILLQMAIRHWNLTFGYMAFAFGYERMLAIAGVMDGLVTASAMLLLVPRLGYAGAVAGSIIGVCLTSLPATMITVARELDLSLGRVVAPFWPWFWRCALVAFGCALLARNWTPQSPVQMISIASVAGLVYCAIQFKTVLKSPLGPYLRQGTGRVQAMFLKLQSWVLLAGKQGA
jgi:O-antigen/teichoic acid export membrane protein